MIQMASGTTGGDVMNTKYKKRFRGIVITILVVVLLWMFVPTPQIIYMVIPASKPKISWMYARDKGMLVSVADYFKESGHYGIYIPDGDYYIYDTEKSGYMTTYNSYSEPTGPVPIEDKKVLRNINTLFKYGGYGDIGKEGNTIYFNISTAREHDRGIAYTIDGEPPVLDFVVEYKLLSSDGHWYFYEENWTKEYRLQVLHERFGE